MSYVKINGKDYKVPEVTFDTICKLEECGISLIELSENKRPKIALLSRAFVAWIMDIEPEQASAVINDHIKSGGNIVEILDAVYSAIADAGFFGQGEPEETAPAPQPNRSQRRHRKKNTVPLQK